MEGNKPFCGFGHVGNAMPGLRSAFTQAVKNHSGISGLEHDTLRAYCLDWTDDGSPARVCGGTCDDWQRDHFGCGLLSRTRGRGRIIGHCPGWLRTQPIWDTVATLFDAGVGWDWGRPHKLLQALRLIAVYRAERSAELARDHGNGKH